MNVFISYSHEDSLLSDHIAESLTGIGISVSRDKNKTRVSENLYEPLQAEIAASDVVILVATPHSASSRPVASEMGSASALRKPVVPLVADGTSLDEFPPLDAGLKFIRYDPRRYDVAVQELLEHMQSVMEIASTTGDSSRSPAVSGQRDISDMTGLSWKQIYDLLLLDPDVIAPLLEKRLVESAHSITRAFFNDPQYRSIMNLGTLSTDTTDVVVLRHDTLHALLGASRSSRPMRFRIAGTEAGVMYGVGVVKWLLARSQESYGVRGLPEDPLNLVRTCIEIDGSSNWGDVAISDIQESFNPMGWSFRILIANQFLRSPDEKVANLYRGFWEGYLTGTFSSALLAWYGERRAHVRDVPFYTASLKRGDSSNGDIEFRVLLHPPKYASTCQSLLRDLLCPYVSSQLSVIPKSARAVVESFIREIAGLSTRESDRRENVVAALTWLTTEGPLEARPAASHLQSVRDTLHKYVHEAKDISERRVSSVLQETVAAVLMACEDITVPESDIGPLVAALTGQ